MPCPIIIESISSRNSRSWSSPPSSLPSSSRPPSYSCMPSCISSRFSPRKPSSSLVPSFASNSISKIPAESTPATNTRRRPTDRRARAESSSSIKSDRPDTTVVRREESDSASYVRLHHRDSDPPRHANYSPTADATLLVPQPSNPAPPDSVLSALLL